MFDGNYNRIVNRLDPMNLNTTDLGFQPDTARLYIFTPRQLPTQVLRSHRYNFTPDFVDGLSSGEGAIKLLPSRFITSNGSPAIHPDGTGMLLDATTINSMYSFVLIVDRTTTSGFSNMASMGGTRQILIGYIASSEEPYNRRTNTINPNAVLNFTHSTFVRVSNNIGSTGLNRQIYLGSDVDYINEITAQQLPDTTYLLTPQDLINPNVGSDVGMIDASGMSISNARVSSDGQAPNSLSVDAKLKSPIHHMSVLADALESSVEQVKNSNEVMSGIDIGGQWGDPDNAKSYFKANAPGSRMLTPVTGIEPSRPITIGNLDMMFKGGLLVHPYEIPANSQWDVYPQEYVTTKNVMSSFASMTLAALTPACGLAHIVFRYASWVNGNVVETDTNRGWQIIGCSTIVDVPDPGSQLRMLNKFKSYMEGQLFPTLKQVSGDFDIMAYVNVGGEVLVDLNFLDMNSSFNNVGFYETNTRLGGMLNPMVADQVILSNNSAAINYLADSFITKDLGNSFAQNFALPQPGAV